LGFAWSWAQAMPKMRDWARATDSGKDWPMPWAPASSAPHSAIGSPNWTRLRLAAALSAAATAIDSPNWTRLRSAAASSAADSAIGSPNWTRSRLAAASSAEATVKMKHSLMVMDLAIGLATDWEMDWATD
jgi:hypothetical protein